MWILLAVAVFNFFSKKDTGPQLGETAHFVQVAPLAEPGLIELPGKRERPLLIKAFASWCAACKGASWYDTPASAIEKGSLEVLAVSVDASREDAARAARDWPIRVPVAHDSTGEFARHYNIRLLPTYVLIGSDGKVQRVSSGVPGPLDLRAWSQAR